MKKILSLVLALLMLCGCAGAPEKTVQETAKPTFIQLETVSFDESYSAADFIAYPMNIDLWECSPVTFRFFENNGQLELTGIPEIMNERLYIDVDDPGCLDGSKTGKFNSSEYCKQAITFLCDQEAIRQCFEANGVSDIQRLLIINNDSMSGEVGYVIAAVTKKQVYFMAVPLARAEYGDYIFQKIYTSDEFLAIYGPRPAKVFVDGTEVLFSSAPMLGDVFLEMDLLTLLDALDCEYTYDKKNEIITVDGLTLEKEQFGEILYLNIYRGEQCILGIGQTGYVQGRYTGGLLFYMEFFDALGYKMDLRYDDFSVRINRMT